MGALKYYIILFGARGEEGGGKFWKSDYVIGRGVKKTYTHCSYMLLRKIFNLEADLQKNVERSSDSK